MTFLHPALLWLAPLAAIPIILHLFSLRRIKVIELSTFRFLFETHLQQRRRTRLMELLLAILRSLVLAGLIFAVGRPFVGANVGWFVPAAGRQVCMAVDVSASSSARSGGLTALDRAKLAARKILDQLSSDDQVTLVRVAAKPEILLAGYAASADVLRDKLDGLQPTATAGDVAGLFAELVKEPAFSGSTCYLFTDVQATGFERAVAGSATFAANAGLAENVVLVDVGAKTTLENRGVVGSPAARQRAIVGLPVLLEANVVSSGATKQGELPIRLFADDKEIRKATVKLTGNAVKSESFAFTPLDAGPIRMRFEIPADAFPDDDQYRFNLLAVDRVKVLFVNGRQSGDPLDDEGTYFKTAIATAQDAGKWTEQMARAGLNAASLLRNADAAKALAKAIEIREVPEWELNSRNISEADIVVLANCGGIDPQRYSVLREAVASGTGLLLFPGDRVNADNLNRYLLGGDENHRPGLAAVDYAQPVGNPDKTETFDRWIVRAAQHPVFLPFSDPKARYWTTTRMFRRMPLVRRGKLADVKAEKKSGDDGIREVPPVVLAEFGDARAALVEARFGSGVALLAGFSLSPRWGNLPLKPEFVPLILQMIAHVEQSALLDAPPVATPESTVEIAMFGMWGGATGTVSDPLDRPTEIAFDRSNNRLAAFFDKTDRVGYYRVEVQPQGQEIQRDSLDGQSFRRVRRQETRVIGETANRASIGFAVNVDPAESNLTRIGVDELERLFPKGKFRIIDATAESPALDGEVSRRELWRPILILVAVIFGMEFLLATLGGKVKNNEEGPSALDKLRPSAWVGEI